MLKVHIYFVVYLSSSKDFNLRVVRFHIKLVLQKDRKIISSINKTNRNPFFSTTLNNSFIFYNLKSTVHRPRPASPYHTLLTYVIIFHLEASNQRLPLLVLICPFFEIYSTKILKAHRLLNVGWNIQEP